MSADWDSTVLGLWDEHRRALGIFDRYGDELSKRRVVATFAKFACAFDPDGALLLSADFKARVMAGNVPQYALHWR